MKTTLSCLGVATVIAFAATASAHHSRPAAYHVDQRIVIEGVVTQLFWRNPHPFLFVEVEQDDGSVVTWAAEMAPTIWMTKHGYDEDSIAPGERIMVIGNPGREGKRLITFDGVYRPADGWVYGRDPRSAPVSQ